MSSGFTALVSIIIPSYNYANFIAEAVSSALQQSHNNLQVIVVDDGSTDDTQHVVSTLMAQDNRIHYISQSNQGLSAARNTGIKHASGDFLVFLDADDVLHPDKIQAHLEHFSQVTETDISYGRSRYFLSGNPEETFANIDLNDAEWMPSISGNAAAVMPALVVNNIMPVCSAMLRRKLVEQVGDFDISLKSLEDWDYWLRAAALNSNFSFISDERLAAYIRVHDVSMSKNALRMLVTQYSLRLKNIPRCIGLMANEPGSASILRDNAKRRLRCLTTIADEMGVCNRQFLQLCRDESPVILLKMLGRLLRAQLTRKNG